MEVASIMEPGDERARQTAMKTDAKVWAPVATFVAVLGVGAAAVVVSGSGGDSGPRPLRLAGSGVAAMDAKLGAPVAAGGTSGGYALVGSLPQGRPDDAPAWTLPGGAGPAGPVARLASALGEGTPTRQGDGWRAGGLSVSGEPGRSWWWSPCGADAIAKGAPDTAVSSSAACAVDTPGAVGVGTVSSGTATTVDPAPSGPSAVSGGSSGSAGSGTAPAPPPSTLSPPLPPPTPTEDAVRRAAAPVLEALGLSDADVQAFPGGGSATVRPTVGGREVSGLATTVSVGADGHVVGASGWLAEPLRADAYPLVTAKEAFDHLPPMARVLSCAVTPEGGCKEPGPLEVTGAHLGLTVAALREGGQVLVPAWLFEVKGDHEPVAAVAVQEKYLPQDDPAASEPAIDPGTPESIPPALPSRMPLSFDGASAGSGSSVVVQYGDSSSCPHTGVTHDVKEDDTTVYVFLQADPMATDQVCTTDYVGVKVTVDLQAPLGDRTVVDGTTGKPVALS